MKIGDGGESIKEKCIKVCILKLSWNEGAV
jgi:hypothetical protein